MKNHPRAREHVKALWSLFWRMALLTPISLLGLVLFAVVVIATTLPPVYAILALTDGQYLLTPIVVAAWVLWLRYGGPVRKFVSEGFQHASL